MSIGRVPGATGIQPSIVDAKGDLIVATAADSVDRLAVGTNNQVLTADSSQATGLKYANGSAATLTTTGDLLYASAANTPARLGIGSTNQVLTVSGGVPTWAAASSPSYTFTSYTPTGGFTIGNGTADGAYVTIGDFVYGYFKLDWGSTSVISEIGMHVTLPVAVNAAMQTATMPLGEGIAYDTSAGEYYPMIIRYRGTNKMKLLPTLANGTYTKEVTNGVDQGVPFTYASGDAYYGWFAYRK